MAIKGPVLKLTAKTNYDQVPLPVKESPVTFRKETWFCFVVLWFCDFTKRHLLHPPPSTSPKKEAKYQNPSISSFISVSLAPVFFFQGSITFLCHSNSGVGQVPVPYSFNLDRKWTGRWELEFVEVFWGGKVLPHLKFEIDAAKWRFFFFLNRDIFSKPSLLVSMLKFPRCKFGGEVVEDFGDVFVLFLVCMICSWGLGIKTWAICWLWMILMVIHQA